MDPISAMIAVAGLVTTTVGMFGAKRAASSVSSAQSSLLGQEEQENTLRQQAMNLSAHRQTVQNLRNVQRLRALGLAGSVNQGANMGSGTRTGAGQTEAQGGVNQLGITQNQQIGNQIFGIDANIGQLRSQIGNAQTSLSNNQGIMALGSSITASAGAGSNLGKQSFGSLNSFFAPDLGFGG